MKFRVGDCVNFEDLNRDWADKDIHIIEGIVKRENREISDLIEISGYSYTYLILLKGPGKIRDRLYATGHLKVNAKETRRRKLQILLERNYV